MTEAKIVGGSEADRQMLVQLHEEYLVANGKFDWPGIEHVWSAEPHATFFNLNGHTYQGAEHWKRLWAFYGKNVQSTLALGEARGVALFVTAEHGIPVSGYAPAAVKQAVVGHGRASKDQIGYLVRALLALGPNS